MGKVYLAIDPVLNRQVAIKVIAVDSHLDDKTRREYLSRFALEARLSARLNHPSIVPVYDAGEDGGVPWIAFQFIDGVTLDKILKSHGKLTVKWALHIIFDIASALQQAHRIEVVHRDIKPANIIIDRNGGVAKLTDFGVAKVPWESFTCEGNTMGSPGYMSPEQVEGLPLDERSDLFSLGVILYEMITGRHPFARETVTATAYATIGGKFTKASELVKGLPSKLDDIITHCLDPNPATRIPSVGKFIDLLRTVVPGGGSAKGHPFGTKSAEFLRLLKTMPGNFTALKTAIFRKLKKESPPQSRPAGMGKTWMRAPVHPPARHWQTRIVALLRHDRMTRGIAIAGGLIILTLVILMVASGGDRTQLILPLDGLDNKGKSLVEKFRSEFQTGRLDSALQAADDLAEIDQGASRAQFLRAIIAVKKATYDDALFAFDAAGQDPLSENMFRRNGGFMTALTAPALEKGRAPDALITILAKRFSAADESSVKKALYEKPYWPRWNSLRICQAAGKNPDLVKVFLLDLHFGTTMHTRVQAIYDLGDLGDRRALPALREARNLGKRDTFVAAAAAKVLREVFREK
jgi:hypothetical protein